MEALLSDWWGNSDAGKPDLTNFSRLGGACGWETRGISAIRRRLAMVPEAAGKKHSRAGENIKILAVEASEQTRRVQEEVARRAHEIFESRGSAPGHDVEDWRQAESELVRPCFSGRMTVDSTLWIGTDVAVSRKTRLRFGLHPISSLFAVNRVPKKKSLRLPRRRADRIYMGKWSSMSATRRVKSIRRESPQRSMVRLWKSS